MEEDKYKCPRCGSKLMMARQGWKSNVFSYQVWQCVREGCDFKLHKRIDEPQEEPETNFFAECSTTESLAWQYIGWSAAIINNQTRLPEQTTLADLKEALEHFRKRWEEILNETK